MKKLIIALMLAPTITLAQTVDYALRSTSDGDGVKLVRHSTSANFKNWGIGLVKTDYQTPIYSKTTNGLILVSNYQKHNVSLTGNIGIANTDNKNYLLADLTGTLAVNKHLSLNATVFGDLIDSTGSLLANVTAQGVVIGADANYDKFGVALGSRQIWYSNSNNQTGYYVKPYLSVIDGVNLYLTKRNYTNSNPYNGLYFSPDQYDRSGGGISIRQRVGSTTVSGFVDTTKIKTPFSNDRTTAWRLETKAPLGAGSKISFSIGRDYNNGFSYRYLEASINYAF